MGYRVNLVSSPAVLFPPIGDPLAQQETAMNFSCFRPGSRVAKLAFPGLPLFILIFFSAGMASGASAVGTWSNTDSLKTARDVHTATLLPNGKVLVVGGYNSTMETSLKSAEIYDPSGPPGGKWTEIDSLNNARDGQTATLLRDGKVLVAGGYDSTTDTNLKSVELYNPSAPPGGQWTEIDSLKTGRVGHTATLLLDGTVLVAGGGGDSGYLTSVEIYEPASGKWTEIAPLKTARASHKAILLPTFYGRVIVVGGSNDSGALKSLEMYYPESGDWSDTPESGPSTARDYHTATILNNGQVLVAGGLDWDSGGALLLKSAELSDRQGDFWHPTGDLNTTRANHTATLLPNGQILAAGGFGDSEAQPISISSELFHSGRGTWQLTGNLNAARANHTATLLRNGQVLVAGGWDGSKSMDSAELYLASGANGVPMLNLLLLD
jgi:hypothetical protein